MSLVPWDPFSDPFSGSLLQSWRRHAEQLTADFWNSIGLAAAPAVRIPRIEVLDDGADLVVRAELPGIDPAKVDVQVTDRSISLRGEYAGEQKRETQAFYHSERSFGAFARTLALPVPIDSAQARASFRHGVLEVRAPKRQPQSDSGGRRLQIESE